MNWTEIAILVLTFVVLLGIGVPVAYSIGLSSLVTILITMDPVIAFTTLAQRMATGIDSFSLLAIPFFVLAGQLMNKGGIASRLIDLARAMVGPLPGGLAFINILACMLFGAISGSSVAAASAIGGFMVPRMEKEGYDKAFGAAVNLTSASTGLVIPPSNILIVFSLASGGVSIAALFLAGYIPGLLIGLSLMIVAGIVALKKGYKSNETTSVKIFFKSFLGALPSLLLLVIVIGGIIAGIFTATEASAIAVLYTLILSMVIYKEVKYEDLPRILLDTTLTTTIVLMLVATSMGMSWVLSYENIPQGVSEFLLHVTDNPVVLLLIINLMLLAVGTFMDMTPAVLIFTPIFLPVVVQMGMNPVHFGIVMVGLCTPPVGSLLFVGCSVAGLSIQKVLKPLLPLFLAMIAVLLLVTYVPALSLWLPELFGY